MLNGAKISEIRDKVPEQFKPKGADGDRFSKAFLSARGGADAEPAADQRFRDALDHHNLSMRAADDGDRITATGRVVTGSGAVMARDNQAVIEQKKREDEERENSARNSVNAMKQRLQDIADEWGRIADEYERKLGGINKIGEQLGVKRKPDQSEEEYRRLVNEVILRQIATGEIDANSDMAAMARARDNEYQALDQQARLDQLREDARITGDYSEFNRAMDEADQSALTLREGLENFDEDFRAEIDAEVMQRHANGEIAIGIGEDVIAEAEDATADDFFGFESAEAKEVTRTFNASAHGLIESQDADLDNFDVQTIPVKIVGLKLS